MPTYLKDLDDRTKKILLVYPKRAPVKWKIEDKKAVLIYKKNFTKIERGLHKIVGGPENIKRPLDEIGTDIWLLCDGEHNIADICTIMDNKYKEDIEPVFNRVWKFIEMLLKLHLLELESKIE